MVQTVVLVIIFLILASSIGGSIKLLSVGDIGYSSGFQGPKARFYGVNYHGTKYTANIAPTIGPPSSGTTTQPPSSSTPPPSGTTTPPPSGTTGTSPQPTKPIPGVVIPGHYSFSVASLGQYDTTLRFDPDEYDSGMPNLIGEMTTVFVPQESLGGMASWVPNEWLQHNALIKNPQATYTWNITDSANNSTKVYKMEQWVLKFYMSFTGEWDGAEMPTINLLESGSVKENYFSDLEAWIQLDLTPTWYIQGGGTAYFAVGKIQLSEPVLKSSHDQAGNIYAGRDLVSVSPESQGAVVYAYYGPFGQGTESNTAKTFQGQELNPDLFRDKVYFNVVFNHFGVYDWNEWGTVKYRGDVARFAFDITCFVIGQWDVKDIQKNEQLQENFQRDIPQFTPPSIADYLADPRLQGMIGLIAIAAVGLVVLIVAPEVVLGLAFVFGGRRKK